MHLLPAARAVALVAATWAVAVPAQTAAVAPAAAPASAAWRSAFEAYRAYSEPDLAPWRESNDTVGRIGGWRSYAREAHGAEPQRATAPATPDRTIGPATPPGQVRRHHGTH